MEDAAIVELYWQRAPEAIGHTQEKYGAYCLAIAGRLVPVREDAEECVNDTWLRAWEAMPPSRPGRLDTFLGKITRNLSLDRWRALRAQKRWQGQAELALTELGDCLPASGGVEQEVEAAALAERDIPCSFQESGDFFHTMEISVMLSLLEIVDNPRQDVPLISVLRSPLFGFTAEEVRIAQTGGKPRRRSNRPKLVQPRQPSLFDAPTQTAAAITQEERTAHGFAESAIRPAYPVENGFKADLNRRITDIERQMREEEAKLSAEERQRRHEEEMQPRPFDGLLEPHLKEGSFVRVNTAGVRYQVGYLKDVTRYGATFHPLDLGKEQREKIAAYISVRDAYERLYTYEAESR